MTTASDVSNRPRKLGRGLAALIGAPVSVEPPVQQPLDVSREVIRSVNDNVPAALAPIAPEPVPGTVEGDGRQLVFIAVESVVPSRFQPRKLFDEAGLLGLAESIKRAGVMQPVVVRRSGGESAGDGSGAIVWELVAGERRWRASKLAGLESVPAVVVEISDEEAAQWGIVENVQREDLGAIERAMAYDNLSRLFGLTHAQISDRVGVDRASVTNFIRLLDLEVSIRGLIERNELTPGHGKALLTMHPGPGRVALAQRASEHHWSVRQTENACSAAINAVGLGPGVGEAVGGNSVDEQGLDAGLATTADEAIAQRARQAQVAELEKRLAEHLGTKVRIKTDRRGKKGRIVVQFYSVEQFEGVMGKMMAGG